MKAYVIRNIGITKKNGYNDLQIIQNNYEALEIAENFESNMWVCKFKLQIADYYGRTDQFKQALNPLKEILKELKIISETKDYKENKSWGINLETVSLKLSEMYLGLNRMDSAKIYNNYAKSILDTIHTGNNLFYKTTYYLQDLEINLQEKNIKEAEKSYKNALKIIPSYYNRPNKNILKSYYSGLIAFEKEQYNEAIDNFKRLDTSALNRNKEEGFYLNKTHKMLYKSYLKTNNLEKADYYFEKYLASLSGKTNFNNSVNSKFNKIEVDNYNAEVKNLKKQKQKQKTILIVTTLLFSIIFIVFFIIYRKKQKKDGIELKLLLEKVSIKEKTNIKPKVVSLDIKDFEIKRIVDKLKELEHKKYYLRTDCTASNVAKKIKTNTTYLSKIINSYYKKNFTNYINDLRIDFVLDRLKKDKIFRKYSIQSIANEIGFKSKESFNSALKKRTGVLPSKIIRELDKMDKQ
ncbi:helix-turn-helix domain-containing protein [Lacinutrix jangbogonensis]|uniref:helix-turn-helix domain-containing protein n=1 Tax=Lacinutrix jangbogonensis TaxID=1469557 RepID=UPI00053CF277|nr:helix-turn-helix domain-containing protein [Lacinutrix jangbogonensis]